MRLLSGAVALLMSATLLAGCAGGAPADEPADEDFDDLDLVASDTTGVLRGVVVDEAVRPLAGVDVSLTGAVSLNTTTNADGLFGFSNLQPGPYFVRAAKAGFQPTQTSTEVVAGLADPPIVKLLLLADPATTPYVATYIFDGFIECSGSFVLVGFAACSAAGLPNDKFIVQYELDRPPMWVQSEMHWESTQAVSPALSVSYSVPGEGALLDNPVQAKGPSPLLLQANETKAANMSLAAGNDLMVRVFNEGVEGTTPSDPVNGDDCLDRPGLGGCAVGFGVTVSQTFTILTNVFYGFAPDPSWRYAETGPHPQPA